MTRNFLTFAVRLFARLTRPTPALPIWTAVVVLLMPTLACAVIDPPSIMVPTPLPTAPPLQEQITNNIPANTVFDPTSNVVPNVDPDIETLVNAVSQQQLTAYVRQLTSYGTRNAFSSIEDPNFGVGAARNWIYQEFTRVGEASNGRLQVDFNEFPLNFNGFTADQQNVIATLPGTGAPNDVIVLMAHYDTRPPDVTDGVSRAPGANDNGSGVALLLESARLLSSRNWQTTIVFAALAAEEQGTYGSKNLVQQLVQNGSNVIAALNYDTVGGRVGIPQSIRMFAPDFYRSESGQFARYYDYIAGLYVPTFPITLIDALDREGRWGDQREFVFAGMPAVRLTESVEDPDMVNSPRDTWDTIDYNYLQQVTQMTVAVIGNMAGAPVRPAPPTIVNMADPGSFLLTWTVNPLAEGYAISFRPTNAAEMPPFRFVSAHEAGNVALTGYDPIGTYAVSIAPIGANGRLGMFSPEVVIAPPTQSQ